MFIGKTGYVEIPKKRAIDVDDPLDYEIIKSLSKS